MFSLFRFVCKNSGVLFENQTLQIGLKSEFKQNLGELLSRAAHVCKNLKLHVD